MRTPEHDAAAVTDLSTLVPSFKRAVAPPGEYETLFPASTDAEITGLLADALAESQLDNFLGATALEVSTTEAGGITANTTPDLKQPEQALVVLYAMARHVSARLANLKTSSTTKSRYKAGSVEAENETTVQQAATVLSELLKEVAARKQQLLDTRRAYGAAAAFGMVDLYVTQSLGDYWYGNYAPGMSPDGWRQPSGMLGGPVIF